MVRCYSCMREYEDVYDMCPFCGHTQEEPPKELYFLQPGSVIAERYLVGTSIGSGGFGITYKAWDTVLAKVVAVKEYYPAGLVNRIPGEKRVIIYSGSRERECANGMVRFLEEAQNMAKFNTHPNIINVYDFFQENNTAYIIMEFLDGENYKEYIKHSGGKVPVEKALEVTEAVLEALKEVHKSGILHRDISPDNIFICRDGAIKLIDFGAARFSSTEDVRTRSVILKPGFAPPEQYQTKSRQGPWTDIYAVGATLYRAITGNVPEESVNRVEEDQLTDPKKFCPEITQNLNNVILRAMALLPELRFQTTAEFQDALRSNDNIKDVRKELAFRKKRRLISIAAISVVVLAGAVACFRVLRQKKEAAAVLEEAKISIWIPAESGTAAGETQYLFEDAIAQFMTDYPQIEVKLTCMERKEYDVRLAEAMESGNLPTLFESSHVAGENFDKLADVSRVFQFIDKNQYYFLDRYDRYFESGKQLPLSFCVPVVYYNTLLNTEEKEAGELMAGGEALLTAEAVLTAYNLYSGREPVLQFDDAEKREAAVVWAEDCLDGELSRDAEKEFLDSQAACILADTTLYNEVQQAMAGIYGLEFLSGKGVVGSFRDCYSINKTAGESEKAAAVQVLVYLLTDTAQDIQYVQNGDTLPLNKSVYKAYVGVNTEFAELESCFDAITFAGEEQEILDAWYADPEK